MVMKTDMTAAMLRELADHHHDNVIKNKELIRVALLSAAEAGLYFHFIRTQNYNYADAIYQWLSKLGYDVIIELDIHGGYKVKVLW